jgi:hypothetical protein
VHEDWNWIQPILDSLVVGCNLQVVSKDANEKEDVEGKGRKEKGERERINALCYTSTNIVLFLQRFPEFSAFWAPALPA